MIQIQASDSDWPNFFKSFLLINYGSKPKIILITVILNIKKKKAQLTAKYYLLYNLLVNE